MAMKKVDVVTLRVPRIARNYYASRLRGFATQVERNSIPFMRAALDEFLRDVVEAAIQDTALTSRSGNLFRQLRGGVRVFGSGNFSSIRGVIRAESYAALHEYGGTVTPKNAQALTIPLPAALRPDGTPKLARATSWRRIGSFIYKSKRTGQGYIARKDANGRLILLYVLVDSATFEAKLGLNDAIRRLMPQLEAAWGGIIAAQLAQINVYDVMMSGTQKGGVTRITRALRR